MYNFAFDTSIVDSQPKEEVASILLEYTDRHIKISMNCPEGKEDELATLIVAAKQKCILSYVKNLKNSEDIYEFYEAIMEEMDKIQSSDNSEDEDEEEEEDENDRPIVNPLSVYVEEENSHFEEDEEE